MFKKIVTVFLSLLFIQATCFAESNSLEKGGKQEFVIATGFEGGTWHTSCKYIAELLNEKLASKGYSFKVIPTLGSLENIELLQSGKAQFATIQGLFSLMASEGIGAYKGKKTDKLKAVFHLWPTVENYTIKSKYIKTGNILDLKGFYGKSFSLGPDGADTRIEGNIILSSLGIDYEKMTIPQLGYMESSKALLGGEIDGMSTPSYPVLYPLEALFIKVPTKISMLEFREDQLKAINEKYPVWSPFVIKKGMYTNQNRDVHTIAQPNILTVSNDVSEKVVYDVMKVVYENLPLLHSKNDALKEIKNKKMIELPPINFHKGAMEYYKENGVKFRMRDAAIYKFFG